MPNPYQAPDRLKHVFEHFGIDPKFTPERAEWLKNGSGFVYVIQCEGFTKIGVAADAEGRLAYLQVGNPFELRLLKKFLSKSPFLDEERLQDRFGRYHVRGEWYRLPDRILRRLISLVDLSGVKEQSARVRNRERQAENQEKSVNVQQPTAPYSEPAARSPQG